MGLLIAYNLVRRKMIDISKEAGVEPIRISFRHTLQVLRTRCLVAVWAVAISGSFDNLDAFRAMMRLLILPPRRRHRHYERHVKAKPRKYKRNPGRCMSSTNNTAKSQKKTA